MPRGGHNRVPNSVKKKRGTFRKDRSGKAKDAKKPANPSPFDRREAPKVALDERAALESFDRQLEAVGTLNRASPEYRHLYASLRVIWDGARADPDMPPTALATIARVLAGLQAAGGLTPASFDKVAAGEEKAPEGGPRVSLRGGEEKTGIQ